MRSNFWSTVAGVWMWSAIALLAVPGCKEKPAAPPPQQEVLLNVSTVDLQAKPVESVRFYINNKKFGITDQEGKFSGKYPAKNGDTLTFNVEAPDGYSVPPNPDQSRWQVKIQYPADGRPLQIDFRAELQRPERDYLLIVRAEPEGTPIKVNDVPIGQTGPAGDALVKISGVPGTQFTAVAGTFAYKGTFSEDDEVYLLTPSRTGPVAEGPAGAAPVAVAPPTEVPTAAEAAVPVPAEPGSMVVAVNNRAAPAPEPAGEGMWGVAAAPTPAPREAPPPRTVEVHEADPLIDDTPAPRTIAVAAAPPPPPPEERAPAIDDLLPPDDPTPPEPLPPTVAPPPPKPKVSEKLGDGLMGDAGDAVDPSRGKGVVALSAGGPSAATMSREEIDGKLEQIQSSLASSKVLTRSDADFLAQIDRTHPGYYEAHRLLADYHHKNKDFRRQAEELEVATSSGRYKRDPTILLSLAKCYAQTSRYGKALSAMQRVEENMRNLPPDQKADAYKFYAEMYEFEFQRQYNEDAKKANASLLDKAIHQWERFVTFARGSASAGGVPAAEAKIKKLEEIKNGLEL